MNTLLSNFNANSSFLKHKLYAYNFSALAVCNILKFLWLWIIFCYHFSSSLYNFPHITLFNPTLAILNFRFFSPFNPQHLEWTSYRLYGGLYCQLKDSSELPGTDYFQKLVLNLFLLHLCFPSLVIAQDFHVLSFELQPPLWHALSDFWIISVGLNFFALLS